MSTLIGIAFCLLGLVVLQRTLSTCPDCQWHSTQPWRIRRKSLQGQFRHLAETWKQETGHLSNITTRAMHPAYQRIIGMGPAAVPYMLEEFKHGRLDDWFWALSAITGEHPMTDDIAGDIECMAEAWLRWGRVNGYLNDSVRQIQIP